MARPLTPVSISSKIRVSTISPLDKIDFIASIILDISPPEAILLSGLRFSPGFVEIKKLYVITSAYCKIRFSYLYFKDYFYSCQVQQVLSLWIQLKFLFQLIFFAAAVKGVFRFFTSSFIASIVFSKFSISAISSSHLLRYSKTESISKQLYLRFKSDINASLF